MRTWWLAGLVALAAAPAGAQTLIDRTVSRVNDQVIMASDVRHARTLRLVAAHVVTDEEILTELENRLLILAELARAGPPDPRLEDIAARRQRWEQLVGPENVPRLLAETQMTTARLTAWFRDEERIQDYLEMRFSRLADPAAAQRQWLQELRRRAGLKPGGRRLTGSDRQ
jgi:hypothetical protein